MRERVLHKESSLGEVFTSKRIQIQTALLLLLGKIWNSETENYLLQWPKHAQHQSKIYQAIDWLGNSIDPLLHGILGDGIGKCLGQLKQTVYDKNGPVNKDRYYHIQRTHQDVKWDNLVKENSWRLGDWYNTNTHNHAKNNANNQTSKKETETEPEPET